MLRELSRSTLYSSSWPSSRRATRRSSFSTLIISLLPVLRRDRPRNFFTCSIIVLQSFRSHRGKSVAELHGSNQKAGRARFVGVGGDPAGGRGALKNRSKKLGGR